MPTSSPDVVHAPHAPLRDYYPAEEDRHGWVLDIFNDTAADYERIERMMALGSGSWYRRRSLLDSGLVPGMTVLDIGVGTGLVAREAAQITGDPTLVTGVDPSVGMVTHAKVPSGVRLLAGSAESIPAPDHSADLLSMGYALRHISDLPIAFREFYRVLKPGGRLCLLEITRPENVFYRALLKFYMRGLIPLVASVVGRRRGMPKLMRYYWDTIEACAPPAAIMAAISAAGFIEVRQHIDMTIFSRYFARKPL